MNLEQKIEAVLFWKNEPISIEKLVKIFKVSKDEIANAIAELATKLSERGIVLLVKPTRATDNVQLGGGGEITLGTNPELSDLIESLQKEELNKNLSKASLEALSIILYKNGATRAEIDYIRGVNSSFTLRALSVRGLVEKNIDERDNRRYIYRPTFELLSFMGIKSPEELPDYEEVSSSIETAAQNLEDLSAQVGELGNEPEE
jgi:segregation and condensation protein B